MDFFHIYLPIAGLEFNVLLLLLIGFTVGVCGGFFGIGGAWIVTPALNIFGFPMPYAIGTDLAHMGGKSIVSTIRHGKFGNVDIKLGVSMIVAREPLARRRQRLRIPPMLHFPASGITCSIWLPILVGFTTGVVASVLGVGGGFIRMPALIYLIGCPTLGAVGA